MSKKSPKPSAPPAYSEHPMCPFTGQFIEIHPTDDGVRWFGRVSTPYGNYHTSLFKTKDQLLTFLSTRDGVRPDSPNRIVVRESSEPEPTGDEEIRDEIRELDEAAIEFVSRRSVDGKRK